jgi:hypothetical protein
MSKSSDVEKRRLQCAARGLFCFGPSPESQRPKPPGAIMALRGKSDDSKSFN